MQDPAEAQLQPARAALLKRTQASRSHCSLACSVSLMHKKACQRGRMPSSKAVGTTRLVLSQKHLRQTPSNLTNHQVLAIAIINPPTDSISIPFPSAQQKQRQRAATGNMALNSFFNNKIEAMKLEIIERNSKLRRLEAQRNDYNSRGTTTLYDYAKLSIGYC
jgi:hypothetical protein